MRVKITVEHEDTYLVDLEDSSYYFKKAIREFIKKYHIEQMTGETRMNIDVSIITP